MNKILLSFTTIYMVLFPYNKLLPEKSIVFINDYFNYNECYEVIFNDDTVIIFDSDGYWKEIRGNFSTIPINSIDKKILNTVKIINPNAAIINIKNMEYVCYKFR